MPGRRAASVSGSSLGCRPRHDGGQLPQRACRAARTGSSNNQQAAGDAGDLSNVYRSDITRANPDLNQQPGFYPALDGRSYRAVTRSRR